MRSPLDHEQCSALLRAYLAGEAGEAAPAVEEHLEQCEQCSAEVAVIKMMLIPVEPPTSAERTRLRAGVMRAAHSRRAASDQQPAAPARHEPPARTPWRFLTALGAAMVLVIAVATMGRLMGTSGGGSASGGGGSNAPRGALSQTRTPGGAAEPNGAGTPGQNEAKPGAVTSVPTPRFGGSVGSVDQAAAHASTLVSGFARTYSGSQIPRLAPTFQERMVRAAPPELSPQVRLCAGLVGDHALPVYGATTTVGGRRALVLIFASPAAPGGPLTQERLYAWPIGSCGEKLVHRTVTISP
jgi:hypothetical protein